MSKLKRILLVEDSARAVELSLAALAECHLANEIVVVRDGAEALDYLFRRGPFAERPMEHPAVVLLDMKMPKIDGMEVLSQVKSNADLRTIPIVMLTSSREEKDLVESYKRGVNAYIVKPIDFEQFVEAVKQLGLFWAVLNETPHQASSNQGL